MALLTAGDGFALEVRHLSNWPDEEQPWLNYEFRFLFQGQPLFDPAAFDQNPHWGIRAPAGFFVNDYTDFDVILYALDDALGPYKFPLWETDELDADLTFFRPGWRPDPGWRPAGDDRWLVIAAVTPRELHCGGFANCPALLLEVTLEQLQQFREQLASEWEALEPSASPNDD